jgi:fatty acyl-CoA reductase
MSKIDIDSTKSIPAFYAGQSIFLTGATGFLGKVFVEKVLRSCKEIREVFLLIRPKKGIGVNERLEKMLSLPVYDKLRNEQPSSFKKLIPISGDLSKKELGLSPADKQILIESVTIIVHASADVKFNESLRNIIFSNTRSTRDICVLAENMKNLVALVYVSTAYMHTDHPVIEEKVYPSKADWRKTIEIAESSLDDHVLNIFTAKYMNNAANTYVFSKNLAESIIKDYSTSLPCAIIRPTMVLPALNEPYPGWVDNIYGPIGICIGITKGILRVVFLHKEICQDWIPVDIVIKSLLHVIWKRGTISYDNQSTVMLDSTPLVFNCASGNLKKVSMSENLHIGCCVARETPYEDMVWTPNSVFTNNYSLFYILTMLWHILPAVLIDLILKWFNRQPIFLKLHRNVYVATCALKYFMMNHWTFDNTNTILLNETVPPNDVKEFKFQLEDNRINYFKVAILGCKKFLFHEDISPTAIQAARARSKRLEMLDTILKTCIILGALWTVYHWNILSSILRPLHLCMIPYNSI